MIPIPVLRVCLAPLLAAALVVGTGFTLAQQLQEKIPRYVGSKACLGCHAGAAEAWAGSHHAWAWRKPEEAAVLGDFDGASISHKGVTTRFMRKGGRYVVETDGPDGKLHEFEVHSTAGIEPLQQYLLETEKGRLQALDLAWDAAAKRWYHLYPSQELTSSDGLHWTGPYKNWNARCAECHATGYKKSYDARTRRYSSSQAEIGVGCEACHGPGEAHVAWAKNQESYNPQAWRGLTSNGLTIGFSADAPESEIQQCAGCHSRREPLGDGNPLPGTAFHDAYRLALLRPGLYHADGSIEDEVYVYGSFLQSKMYAKGVRCSDCHNPHSAELKAEGNAVCTQCHSPAGNPRFPTLKKVTYDAPSHHFHASGTQGAQCKSCHMIERVYMGVDPRRDHSFRVPRPDLSEETGAPNACTDCHKDRDASWAAAEIAKRFPDSTSRGDHFSQVFAAFEKDPTASADGLLAIAKDKNAPGIIRASALDRLRRVADLRIAETLASLLKDTDPLVREAAVGVQRGASATERVQRLLPLLEDRFRSIRIAVVRELLDAPIARLPSANEAARQRATEEWHSSLMARADFPETHMVLGGTALVLRNPGAAEQAFREAVRQDPQLVDGWRMIARIRAAIGDPQGARAALEDALKSNPGNPMLESLRRQLN